MTKIVISSLALLFVTLGVAVACPEGYHRETRTDPCGRKENQPVCVRWEDGVCTETRDNWVCIPTSTTTCEPD